jgi:hypothetical protein
MTPKLAYFNNIKQIVKPGEVYLLHHRPIVIESNEDEKVYYWDNGRLTNMPEWYIFEYAVFQD